MSAKKVPTCGISALDMSPSLLIIVCTWYLYLWPKAGSQLLHKLIDYLGPLNGFLSLIDAGESELIRKENAVIQTMNSTLQEASYFSVS